MNKFSKHLSLSVIVLSLITHTNTHCMRINKLVKSFNPAPKRTYRTPLNSKETEELQDKLHDNILKTTRLLINSVEKDPLIRKELESGINKASTLGFSYILVNVTKDVQTKCAGLNLLNFLIDQDSLTVEKHGDHLFLRGKLESGIDIASALAAKEISHPNTEVQIAALKLLSTLVGITENNNTFKIAAQAAQKAFSSKNYSVKKEALNLFDRLFGKSRGFETATETALTALINEGHNTQCFVLKFLGNIIDRRFGQCYKQPYMHCYELTKARTAVSIGMTSNNKRVQMTAIELLNKIRTRFNIADETRS